MGEALKLCLRPNISHPHQTCPGLPGGQDGLDQSMSGFTNNGDIYGVLGWI